MSAYRKERRALQASIAIAALVPVAAGLWGVVGGLGAPGTFADGHVRYLSGLLLGAGLLFWLMTPEPERWPWPFRTLGAIILMGGLARLGAALAGGTGSATFFALFMELIVTPGLLLWRERIQRLSLQPTSVPVTVDGADLAE